MKAVSGRHVVCKTAARDWGTHGFIVLQVSRPRARVSSTVPYAKSSPLQSPSYTLLPLSVTSVVEDALEVRQEPSAERGRSVTTSPTLVDDVGASCNFRPYKCKEPPRPEGHPRRTLLQLMADGSLPIAPNLLPIFGGPWKRGNRSNLLKVTDTCGWSLPYSI